MITIEEPGSLDSESAVWFQKKIESYCEGERSLILNLQDLEFIDSAGVRALIEVYRLTQRQGVEIRLTNLTPGIRNVFEVTRLQRLFSVHSSVDEALASFLPRARAEFSSQSISFHEEKIDGVLQIFIQGTDSLDATNAATLRTKLEDCLQKVPHLVMDMGSISFIDSTGMVILMSIWGKARACGGDVRLSGVRPGVRQLFEASGLDKNISTFTSSEAAVASYHQSQNPPKKTVGKRPPRSPQFSDLDFFSAEKVLENVPVPVKE